MSVIVRLSLLLFLFPLQLLAAAQPLHHELRVSLDPASHAITARDRITLPAAAHNLTMDLHPQLEPKFSSPQGPVELLDQQSGSYYTSYQLKLPRGTKAVDVTYTGKIHHQLSSSHAEQARGFRSSSGIIGSQGVFLASSSLWYPQLRGYPYLTFELRVELPSGWSSVSQGRREQDRGQTGGTVETWRIDQPQEEIYLIAARFSEYSRSLQGANGPIDAQVFLRKPDQPLADKYLEATASYLKMYEQLLGPYAYSKFALVENFWQTGFGMPSFTLLGSRVIRLPFIINSSYPHEILHNWWGNGVYIDFASGNWSEGLTAYLADHLIKEQQGQAVKYRQQSLQKYRDYAANNRDFPLSEFRSRHSSATEAVGYGKTLMLFHMLRKKLGDEVFVRALQAFYRDYRFRVAAFDDVRQVFERVSGQSLAAFFDQWVQRSGAPRLQLETSQPGESSDGFTLELTLAQVQPADVFTLDVPLAVSLEGQRTAEWRVLSMQQRQQTYTLKFDKRPTRVDIDPQFDLFRELATAETPPAFTRVFGASELLVVTPSAATDEMRVAWQAFANDVSHMGPEQVRIVSDDRIDALPEQQAVMVLGWNNRFTPQIQHDLARHPVGFEADRVQVDGTNTQRARHAFAWVTRVEDDDGQTSPRALVTADLPAALTGLARKIPHYHRYSYLAFEGEEPTNRLKGRWPVADSPMARVLSEGAARGELPGAQALVDPVSVFDPARMLRNVQVLSDPVLRGRGLGSDGLDTAAAHIAQAFQRFGLQPAGDDGGYFQHFKAVGEDGKPVTLKNVVAVIPGRHPTRASENLVLGAHYDHLGLGWPDVRRANQGKIHPGADDNASGVAVMLELARILGRSQPERTMVFVAFSGEEAGRLGSRHYVNNAGAHPVDRTIGMLNLDTVGRLFDGKLMVLGGESAAQWPHIFRGIGFVTGIQTAMVNEPLDASDQQSFHEVGVPAVQLFSGPNADYHGPGDSADKIDAEGLVKVAEVSKQVVEYLASREEPMSVTLASSAQQKPRQAGSRKVSLGTVPDFTYRGRGYRLDGVTPGSPAERAGLQEGDIIVQIDGQPIAGLRDLSNILKTLTVGGNIEVVYLRGGHRMTTEAMLTER